MKIRHYIILELGLLIVLAIVWWLVKNNLSIKAPCLNCNIILIDVDTFRADELPCYGYSRNTTPNICALAKKGVLFEDNYTTESWTLPSIISTITSLYPTFHKVKTLYVDKLANKIPTLAETLQKKGYQTIYVADGEDDGVLSKTNGGLRGFDRIVSGGSVDKVMAEMSKTSKPWFIYYFRTDLHMPYLVPDGQKPLWEMPAPKNLSTTYTDFDQKFNIFLKKNYSQIFQQKAIDENKSIILGPDKPGDITVTNLFYKLQNMKPIDQYLIEAWKPRFNTYMSLFDQYNPADVAYVRMMYDTKMKTTDEDLGRLFQKLDSEQFSKNTITVISSEHGESFGEHGTFSHDVNDHSELFWIPLIIYSPNIVAKTVSQPTSIVDIFPTLLDLVGIKRPAGLQGYSLLPLVDDPKLNSGRFILSELGPFGIIWQNKNWLYYLPNGAVNPTVEESVLYDKISDPQEKINVAAKYPELTLSLFKQAVLVRSYKADSGQDPKQDIITNGIRLSPEKLKKLQKEGYF